MTKEFIIALIDQPSPSGRTYPKEVMEEAVRKANIRADEGAFIGIFEDSWPTMEKVPNLNNISHLIKHVRIDGNMVIAEIEILETPKGYKLMELLENKKEEISFSVSGAGKLDDQNRVTDYEILSIPAHIRPRNTARAGANFT